MITKNDVFVADNEKLPELSRGVLLEQVRWLVRLRWLAVAGIVPAALICTHIFPVLADVVPIYVCAAILFVSNVVYVLAGRKRTGESPVKDVILAMAQIEVDIVLLTAMIHFSGGITNPFVLFYVFHVIIATIILPKVLSFAVGISAISFYGLMAVGELNGWVWLEHVQLEWYWLEQIPLDLSGTSFLWENPVYVLGSFVAFAGMVVLTQYLTRTVVARMTAKELEASRNRDLLEAIISGMDEGLVFIGNDGTISLCNPEARKWAPGSVGSIDDLPETLTSHVRDMLDADDAKVSSDKLIEFQLGHDGDRYIEATSCPVIATEGHRLGFVIVGQDLTDHKKLEQELTRRSEETAEINEMLKMSRVEMAQREKMVAIGQMATGIAHEIGNPLASLSSVVQYLGRKINDAEQKEQVGLIQHQIERISMILKRMLSLSRPATSEYKWTDVNSAIDNTIALIKFDRRAKSVEIENVSNLELPMVWLNPLHIEQVLLNLVMNALDAMAAKGGEEQHKLTVTREMKDSSVEIRVSDTGIGMEQVVCRRAFESFFTTKELGKGTGLGLFISYNLISEVDGSMSLESEPGKGTTVIIRVPIRPKKGLISVDGH